MARLRVLAATLAMMLALLATDARGQMNPLRQLALTTADIELLTATANRVFEAGQMGARFPESRKPRKVRPSKENQRSIRTSFLANTLRVV